MAEAIKQIMDNTACYEKMLAATSTCRCSGRPCYHTMLQNLSGFRECHESITNSQSKSICKYICIESLFKDRMTLFCEHGLEQLLNFFPDEQYLLCGNCINHLLLSDKLSIFLNMCRNFPVRGNITSIIWVFVQCLISSTFRDIVLSDVDLFGFMCKIWFCIVESFMDDSFLRIGRHQKAFLIRFYLNVCHWTKANIVYFYNFYLRDLMDIINQTIDFCEYHPDKLREYDLIFIVRMRAAIVCQYFRKFRNRHSGIKWCNGLTMDIGVRISFRFDLKSLDFLHLSFKLVKQCTQR